MSSNTAKLSVLRQISALFYLVVAIGISGCGSSSQAPAELPSGAADTLQLKL